MKYVYKITYPNGKIYIGVDLVGKWKGTTYFGSPTGAQLDKDFSWEQAKDMTIRKEVLWHSETATDVEARKVEIELIRKHKSNEPTIGYNLTPKPGNQGKAEKKQPSPIQFPLVACAQKQIYALADVTYFPSKCKNE